MIRILPCNMNLVILFYVHDTIYEFEYRKSRNYAPGKILPLDVYILGKDGLLTEVKLDLQSHRQRYLLVHLLRA